MDNYSDEQLIKVYLKGEEQALEVLIKRYLSPLYNFAFKYTHNQMGAEDVTQEAMVKIWRNLKKFKPQFKFKTWAYTITKNTALDYLKKKELTPVVDPQTSEDTSLLDNLASREILPQEAMEKIDDINMVGLEIKKLPSKYQQIISLYYDHGLNFREISEILKESIDTIKTRHRRAVIYLKRELLDK